MLNDIFQFMDINKFRITFCSFCILIIFGCSKHDNDNNFQPDSYLTYFESLTSDKDTLLRGESTTITAKATGNKITFSWSASVGPILGDGNQVLYIASPCCYGNVIINCEARTSDGSQSKSLLITVLK